ncbi:hypothetical protein V039C_0014 [Vibrio phage V039C]|nr:hypothetical protein V039C_0014 [Vibrio phage V039C]
MRIYNSYQEAKIENPDFAIFNYQGKFGTDKDIIDYFDVNSTAMKECLPADFCITLGELRSLHGGEVGGDVILGYRTGRVRVISKEEAIDREFDAENFVLRSSVMEIPTQSPEEREALDMIDTTSNQVESLANNSEFPIWENGTACFHDSMYGFAVLLHEGLFFKPKDMNRLFSVKPSELSIAETESKKHDRSVGGPVKLSRPEWSGEGLPPVGIECCFTPDNNLWGFASTDTYFGEVLRYEGEHFIFLLSHNKYNMRPCHLIVSRTDKGEFSKPESPEQKAERERDEAIKEMAQTPKPCGFAIYDICEQLYDAGYRKESK